MSNKGISQTFITRYKISASLQKNRTKVIEKLKEYKLHLVESFENKEVASIIPSLVGAALYAGISKRALLSWELTTAEDSELRQILDFIRDTEELYLREKGLLGMTDSKLTTLILEAEHGLKKQPTQLTQNNNFNISPEILAEALELSRSKKK